MKKKCDLTVSKHFGNFLKALGEGQLSSCNSDLTYQIFYDLFKIRVAQFEYKKNANRNIDYALSDIFQDLIARYLRASLSSNYKILLEYKQNKLRPDILVKKNNVNWAIIEVKTTIGWNRDLVKNDNYKERLKNLSSEFDVPLKRIFYIFESSRNVNKEFASYFKEGGKSEITKFILPLFEKNASPFFIHKKEDASNKINYSDKEIFSFYQENVITDFKEIVRKVQ